jgi:simple sugar transport system ATP-binding protein
MVGRELNDIRTREQARKMVPTSAAPLIVENLSCGLLHDFSLSVHGGEIVGLAGVDGNGQSELVGVLSGLRQPDAGRFTARNWP